MKEFDEAFERIIQNLNFQLKAYDGVTQLIAKIKQRSIGLPGAPFVARKSAAQATA